MCLGIPVGAYHRRNIPRGRLYQIMLTEDESKTSMLESLARRALEGYDLPAPVTLRLLAQGLNTTFKVNTGGSQSPLVLRFHRPRYRTEQNIRSELHFLQNLAGRSSHTRPTIPRPVPARDGTVVVRLVDTDAINSSRHCDLITWVAGRELRPGAGLGLQAIAQLGRAMAQVHNISSQLPSTHFEFPRWDGDGMFTASSPFRPQFDLSDLLSVSDRALFDEIADRTRAIFERLDQHADTFGVIHGDFILGNSHLRRRPRGWDVGIFDFDDCGWGYYLYDLCPMLGNLAGFPGAVSGKVPFAARRRALLEGYRSVRAVPTAWEAYLPVLMAARHAAACFLTARDDVSKTPSDDSTWRIELARQCLGLADR